MSERARTRLDWTIEKTGIMAIFVTVLFQNGTKDPKVSTPKNSHSTPQSQTMALLSDPPRYSSCTAGAATTPSPSRAPPTTSVRWSCRRCCARQPDATAPSTAWITWMWFRSTVSISGGNGLARRRTRKLLGIINTASCVMCGVLAGSSTPTPGCSGGGFTRLFWSIRRDKALMPRH